MRPDRSPADCTSSDHRSFGPLPRGAQEFVAQAARTTAPVLLEGETGTGKNHLARYIHQVGPRAGRAFVRADCAALARDLFERELFGHEKGAYTGADAAKRGLVEAADGGTLLLDEVAEVPLPLQSKLLALVDENRYRRLGSTKERRADVRILCATNRDPGARMQEGAFREDLYYRCSVLRYHLSPLRKRTRDLPEIASHLLHRLVSREIVSDVSVAPAVSPEAMDVLRAHSWPGNIRELRSVLIRALLCAGEAMIEPEHLPAEIPTPQCPSSDTDEGSSVTSGGRYQAPEDPEEERQLIVSALRATAGNRKRASQRLGMSRQTLWRKIGLYRIAPCEWEESDVDGEGYGVITL